MQRPIIIGIAGGTGSGKTTVALSVQSYFPEERVEIIHHDDYYRHLKHLSLEERVRINYDHPDAFDTPFLLQQLEQLQDRGVIQCPIYDYERHQRLEETRKVGPADIVLLEGILVLENEQLRDSMDIRLFIDEESDERFMRRLTRDIRERNRSVDAVVEQYRRTVRPMYQQFCEPTKRHADLIIPHGGHNAVAIDLMVVKIRDLLRNLNSTASSRS